MSIENKIKLEERTEKLKPFLHKILKMIFEFQLKQKDFDLTDLFPLRVIIREQSEDKKKLLIDSDINIEEIVSEMQEILESDDHLLKCCFTIDRLAIWLDRFIAEVFRLTSGEMPNNVKFEEFFKDFSEITYSEPFEAVVFSHIFNFTSESNFLDFGELTIQKLEMAERARILNDSSIFYYLHPHHNIGEHFVVSSTKEIIEDDWKWQIDERIKAEDFARLFQYYKNGVVHINYSVVRFYPEWINPIRFGGLFFDGAKRRFPYENGEKMYSLNNDEYSEIVEWFSLYQLPDVVGKFDLETNQKNELGKRIELAGTYFEASHTQTELVRKLIDLAIALELLLHPHYSGEISFQISQLSAQLIGRDCNERKEIFKFVKDMYQKRSDVFHGNIEQQEKKPITLEETEKLSDLIRQTLLKMIVLYIRGEQKHKPIIQLVKDSLLDLDDLKTLQEESDISILVSEFKEKVKVIN